MNYSMMSRRILAGFLIVSCIFCKNLPVRAESKNANEKILVAYSDNVQTDEQREQVEALVRLLVCQNYEVTCAKASECVDIMETYSYIICDEIKECSLPFLKKLKALEEQSAGKNFQVMFIGNECLEDYLKLTGRKQDYSRLEKQNGKLLYDFLSQSRTEMIIKMPYFLFLNGPLSYQSGRIEVGDQIGYFCAKSGVITHLQCGELKNPLIKTALADEVVAWKAEKENVYAQYIVIDKAYPYQEPQKLLDVINLLIEKREPFAISVMPIFTKGDYPAMQHFCEVLRYAQANGGAVVLHVPLNHMQVFQKEEMKKCLEKSVEIYVEQGVYPVALQIPDNWMSDKGTMDVIKDFRTIFMEEEMDEGIATHDLLTNEIRTDKHQWIAQVVALDASGTSYTKALPTAVYLDISDDMAILKKQIEACRESLVPIGNLWDSNHEFKTADYEMEYRNHTLRLNKEIIQMRYEPAEYEEYKYNRNVLTRFSKDLSAENRKLLVGVIMVSILFVLFIIIARYRNRQRFFIDVDEHKGEK